MRACFQTVLLFLFSAFISFQSYAGEYEFGVFDTSSCSSLVVFESENDDDIYSAESGCEITFKNTFSTKPIVFLMPTIPSVNPDNDAPQSLALLNVTTKSFSVAQVVAPFYKPLNLTHEPMPKIAYLAIEPGETTFANGHKVYAERVKTQNYLAHGKKSNPAYKYVDLSSKAPFITESPVVLSEVQTRKNKRWLTTAIANVSAKGFNLGLELTRVNIKDIEIEDEESVGYLVSTPHRGETQGYDYEFSIRNTESNSGKNKPLEYSCNSSISLSNDNYKQPPYVIAGKLERKGGHGGWLRHCSSSLSHISIVFDEDVPDKKSKDQRSHTNEKVGFFAFAKKLSLPPLTDDYCEYFPTVAQSHYNDSFLVMMGIKGPFIKSNVSEIFNLGFKKSSFDNNIKSETCRNTKDKWECIVDDNLIVPPFSKIPNVPDGDIGDISYYGNEPLKLVPGAYKKIEIGSTRTVILSPGKYTIEYLDLKKSSKLILSGNDDITELYVRKADINGEVNVDGKPDNLYIFGVTKDPDLNNGTDYMTASIQANETAEIVAYIYSVGNILLSANYGDLESDKKITLRGAVTARNLRLDTEANITGDGACLTPPEDNFILEIEPETAFSLTCDYLPVTFRVKKEDGTLADTYSGSVSVTTNITETGKVSWFPIDSETVYKDVSEVASVYIFNGIGQLRLKSHDYIGNIVVTGQLDDSPSTNIVNGRYTFVPFKFGFSPSPVKVIAGKPVAVKIKALACENDEATVATGYTGTKRLSISSAFLQPSTQGNGDLELKALSSDWQTQNETFSFDNGVAEFSLRYPDAGIVDLKLADPNCSVSNGCDILPSGALPKSFSDWVQLEGSVEVHARPWTFAVCPKNKNGEYVKADGTSSSGEGFVAAGDKFDVDVKPIVWSSAGSETADINSLYSNSIDLCESVITPNFFKAGAPAARVELSIPSDHSITPVNGKPGELQGITVKEHTETLTYTDLSWSEVGSVRLQANTPAKYLGMDINQGYRDIGRFYPKYLELQPNNIIYPNGHDQFAYLGQPFNAQVMIKAKNASGNQVNNYNKFDLAYQADVALTAYEHPSLTSLNHRFSYHNATGSTEKSFKGDWNSDVQQTWLLARKPIVAAINPTTEEDGPWSSSNSRFGGYITENHYPISIRNSTSVDTDSVDTHTVAPFEMTPNLRYGRMVLDDAISPFDLPVNIPLKVEHWDGIEFQTHIADSGSKYNSNYYCKQALHPNDESNTSVLTTNKTGSVNVGKSDQIEAHPQLLTPANYKKQQTRFWLRIATDAPINIGCSQTNKAHQPWLTYNWRELGDEDPSAIVTFGVYRGSDRIVYRGERGLN